MENQAQTKNSGGNVNKILLVLVILLAGLSGYLGWLSFDRSQQIEMMTVENSDLTTEKEGVESELRDMLAQYEEMETNNEELSAELEAEKEKIEELLQKSKNQNWTIRKLRKEAATLREVLKSYVHTIDSLNTLNQELIVEKGKVEQKLGDEKQRSSQLVEQNKGLSEKVKLGAKLKALDMVAIAQRVKSNGIHRETTRAEKAEKIKCCFTIDQNEVTKPGKKKVFLRIINPKGDVLSLSQDENNMFEYEGVKGLYSVEKEIIYDSEELDVCLYWDVTQSLKAGTYIVEAYADGASMGKSKFTLK